MAIDIKSREYTAWVRIRRRCLIPTTDGYEKLGAKGIRVCWRWRESFQAFLEDVGPPPQGQHFRRFDTALHYSCGGCTECLSKGWMRNAGWMPAKEASAYPSTVKPIMYKGLSLTTRQWAQFLGVTESMLLKRLKMQMDRPDEWPLERVFSPWPG
jgi:hypothetical protein